MDTPNEICNLALTEVGNTSFIDSLDDPGEEARICKVQWLNCLRRVFEDSSPSFAVRRASLASLANFSRTNWQFGFTLPPDFVSIKDIVVEGAIFPAPEVRSEFDIEANDTADGRVLLTNLAVVEIRYIALIDKVPVFSAHFVDALVLLLASKLARGLKKDNVLAKDLETRYEFRVSQAGAFEKNQRELQKFEPATPSLRARGGVNVISSSD